MQFDLISDIHVDKWPASHQIEWEGRSTSLVAVVAGDVSSSPKQAYETVLEISKHYRHVIYTDGNHEHNEQQGIEQRRIEMAARFGKYRNVTYLHRRMTILDGVAFIGCNGWFDYEFCEPIIPRNVAIENLIVEGRDKDLIMEQWTAAVEDGEFLGNAIAELSTNASVKSIVVVTHTLPHRQLRNNRSNSIRDLVLQGNTYMENVPNFDVNNKIKIWCYGHVHQCEDRTINDIRYISNPRGIPEHSGSQQIYYPIAIKC
jgi:predicted phosphodiesterase